MKKIEKLTKKMALIRAEIDILTFERKDTSYRRTKGYYGTHKADLSNCIVVESFARTRYLNTYKCINLYHRDKYNNYLEAKEQVEIEQKRLEKIRLNKWAKDSIEVTKKYMLSQITDGTINTNYLKFLITGNRHIHAAHPFYQFRDYNKSVMMPNTAKHRKIANNLNKQLYDALSEDKKKEIRECWINGQFKD